jgi:hypothetical protein
VADDVSYPSLRHPHPGGYDKGRGFFWQASWFAVQNCSARGGVLGSCALGC